MKHTTPRLNINVESLLDFPIPANVYWKNQDGYYMGANDLVLEWLGVKSHADILDRTDNDFWFPDKAAKMFIENDKMVMTKGRVLKLNEYHLDSQTNINFLTVKTPLFDQDGKLKGICGVSHYLNKKNLPVAMSALVEAGFPANQLRSSAYLSQLPLESSLKLSKRQKECVFYLTKGMSFKQIANKISLSPRTVEHYLEAVMDKLGCINRADLIEKLNEMDIFYT